MTPKQKEWIDNAPYINLLRRWRYSPMGDVMFEGDTGGYYSDTMRRKRNEVGEEAHVAASKVIGWCDESENRIKS